MMNLKEFILESVILESFNKSCTGEELLNLSYLNINKIESDKIEELIKLIDDQNIPCLYSEKEKYFKINYEYGAQILNIFTNTPGFEINPDNSTYSDKFSVYYIGERRLKILEMGKGSVGKLKTSTQEEAICYLYNLYIRAISDRSWGKKFDMNDINTIREVLKEQLGDDIDNANDSWYDSWAKQINKLISYINSFGGNPQDYRLTRYGSDNAVSKAYKNMINKYVQLTKLSKNICDPSDIILYNHKKYSTIIKYCKPVGTPDEIKDEFKKKLFETNICQGISLKKISKNNAGAKVEFINVHDGVVKNVKQSSIIKNAGKRLQVECTGSFKLDNGEEVNKIIVIMRPFSGNKNIAIEVKINENEPALGKCPVSIWRPLLFKNDKFQDNMTDCGDAFENNLNDEVLTTIIRGALKEGGYGFPYILLH